MKKNKYHLNILLTGVLSVVLLGGIIVRSYTPSWILPEASIPNLVLVSLVTLWLDQLFASDTHRSYLAIAILSALAFGVLPYAACFVGILEAGKLALLGSVVFTVTTWLYSSMQERLSSYPMGKAAPFLNALWLYLAAQCFGGLVL